MFIPDPGSEFFPYRSASSILTKKLFLSSRKYDPGLFIPDPDPDFLLIPDSGSRGQKGNTDAK
jgi:hypothetical protein